MNGTEERWVAHLKCGHEARLHGEPRPGGWITCTDSHCQGQERIVSVTPVRSGAPAAGEAGIQEPLFDIEAA